MFKRTIAWLLMLVLLAGMLPATVLAQENEVCQACRTHKIVQRVEIGGNAQIGQQLQSNVNVALDYPNNAPAHVDTAAEKAAWIADQCRAKGITDTWEIALWLHDWLIYNANYDYTFSRYTADGVLLEGTGVCDSYTRAYNLLLQQFGIECIRLGSDEMNHAWNLVKIDGQWCHIDATWDDPNEGGYENHSYFGLTDERMALDHEWNRSSIYFPACTSDINYYPIRMGLAFTTAQELKTLLDRYAGERRDMIELWYLGNDPDFSIYDYFHEWVQNAYRKKIINSCSYILQENNLKVYLGYPGNTPESHVHQYQPLIQEPGCESEGYTTYICRQCDDQYTDEYVTPLGHTGGTATCTDQAVCTRCGKAYGELKPDNHAGGSYVKNTKQPSCIEAGYTGDTYCAGCDEKIDSGETIAPAGHLWSASDCTKPKTCRNCGITEGSVSHTYAHKYDYKCDICGKERTVDMTRSMVDMFRMYDPNSGEHFYTGSTVERQNLINAGWKYEGVGFTFPLTTGDPVHRLYDPVTGEHLYTMDVAEMNRLLAKGWNYEGIAFNSGFENEVPQYRLHNPNATRGAYHFTASEEEKNSLIAAGWEYQGIGWYSLGA